VHTGNNQLVYANHFEPDWSAWVPNSGGGLWCPSSCRQTISFADNLAGFQPDYLSIGSGVSIEGRASNRWWAKFDGTSSVRFADTRFRALTDDLRQFAKSAWEVELWFEADLSSGALSTGLFSSPALEVSLAGTYPWLLSITLTAPGVGSCVIPTTVRNSEHHGLRLTVDQQNDKIYWWVSDPVSSTEPRTISDTTGTFGTCTLASNGSSLTDFTIGRGLGRNFTGYIDAIALRRRNIDQ